MQTLHRGADAQQRAGLITWRFQYLVRAGLAPALAQAVAPDPGWDLHALLELLERGCPAALAFRILAPVEGEQVRPG